MIGIVQLLLGFGILLAPTSFVVWMGLSRTPADANYLFGMLAARFIAYGIGMFVIAQKPTAHVFWIKNMILIQAIDLAVGLFYTINGVLPLSVSAFPMFNATLFIALLMRWRPRA